MIENVFKIIVDYKEGLINGLITTMELCLIVWFVGILFGTLSGYLSFKYYYIGTFSRIIAFILGGIPLLVFLFWLHYPVQFLLDIVVDPFITAVLTLSIINIFLVSELIRNTLIEFPKQYIIAAEVCGISEKNIFRKIQFPLLFRQILPSLLLIQVNMLQLTLFASLISVDEIFRVCQRINATLYKPVEIYTTLGIFFLFICLPLNGLALYLKKKYTRNISER